MSNGTQPLGMILQSIIQRLDAINKRLDQLEQKDAQGAARIQGFKDGAETILKLSGALFGFVAAVWGVLKLLG
jgi:hypothetical protein